MKNLRFLIPTLACASVVSCFAARKTERPNVIYILLDDLGYGDPGCYGQLKIETPNIDQLASEGLLFTQHYSAAPVSAAARCGLMTGLHMGHAQIRGNDEMPSRGKIGSHQAMLENPGLEGQAPLKAGTITIGSIMQRAGYKTACIGKWGLGYPGSEGMPNKQGFDYFYGYNCQRMAHTYYPPFLWENDQRVMLNNPDIVQPDTPLPQGADPRDPASYARYTQSDYAPDKMYRQLIGFVEENKQRPFFLMWTTPIPHVPLQAPDSMIQYYVDKFGDEEPYLGKAGYYPTRYPRAAYAAMVTYFDQQVGGLIDKLKTEGLYENTLLIFTSDNGPTFNGGSDSPWFNSGGLFKSEYGWGKCSLHEGGVRVPMIAVWPGTIKPGKTDHISYFPDIMPTLCELIGQSPQQPTDGISLLPTLKGKKKQRQHEFLYWEFPEQNGMKAIRYGKWKGLIRNIRKGNDTMELYNLEDDLREQNDVATNHPEIVAKLRDFMQQSHIEPENKTFRM